MTTTASSASSSSSLPIKVIGNGIPVPTTLVDGRRLASGSVAHAIRIAEAIRASGLGCTEAAIETGPQNGTLGNPAIEQVSCLVGDDTVEISLFADHRSLVAAGPFLQQATCYVSDRQPSNTTYVEGDNWIAFPGYAKTAQPLGEALDAPVRNIHC